MPCRGEQTIDHVGVAAIDIFIRIQLYLVFAAAQLIQQLVLEYTDDVGLEGRLFFEAIEILHHGQYNFRHSVFCQCFSAQLQRGKDGARSLSRNDAYDPYSTMLDGRVSDLEMHGILLAMRIKVESVIQIADFLDAVEASLTPIQIPSESVQRYAPIVIPSYNGSRHMANPTALLSMLLHGVSIDIDRVTSAEIFQSMGHSICNNIDQVKKCSKQQIPAFMSIDLLAPKMARMLAMRRILEAQFDPHIDQDHPAVCYSNIAPDVIHASVISGHAERLYQR